jgi:hypothetical protein
MLGNDARATGRFSILVEEWKLADSSFAAKRHYPSDPYFARSSL